MKLIEHFVGGKIIQQKKQLKLFNQKKREKNLMEHTNVSCVRAAQHHVLVTGGMEKNT